MRSARKPVGICTLLASKILKEKVDRAASHLKLVASSLTDVRRKVRGLLSLLWNDNHTNCCWIFLSLTISGQGIQAYELDNRIRCETAFWWHKQWLRFFLLVFDDDLNTTPRPVELASVWRRYGFWRSANASTGSSEFLNYGLKACWQTGVHQPPNGSLGFRYCSGFNVGFNFWWWITRFKIMEGVDNSRVTLHKPSIVPSKAKKLPQVLGTGQVLKVEILSGSVSTPRRETTGGKPQ